MMDKKAFLAVALSLAIWVSWQKFYLEPIQKQQAAVQQAKQEAEQASAAKKEKIADIDAKGIFPESIRKQTLNKSSEVKSQTVENTNSNVVISNEAGFLKSWELRTFTNTIGNQDDHVLLKGVTGFGSQLSVRFSDAALSEPLNQNWDTLDKSTNKISSSIQREKFSASRSISFDEQGYGAQMNFAFKFQSEPPKFIFLDIYGNPHRANDKEGSIFGQAPDKVKITYRDLSGHHSEIAASHKQDIESTAGLTWLGLDTRYFVLAITPEEDLRSTAGVQIVQDKRDGEPAIRSSLVIPTNGKKEINFSAKMFFGPKHLESLKAVDPVFVDAIDFGWTSMIAIPLLQALKWLNGFVHNYGLAIIILTFLIKVALFPLTYKSMKSMSKIAKLQPQLNAIREKYKNDKEKLNMETMNFMKTNGYNPVGGCLPILLQMPIFFALYRVLFNSMELYQAPFGLWIHDLSSPDPFFITPVILAGLMFVQQKLSPNTSTDPAQQKMLQIMPLMFGMFMLLLPAGLNIYMMVNTIVSIVQQVILNKKFGIGRWAPKTPVKA